MKAAIAVDDWKLPIFEQHLKNAGYAYVLGPGLTSDTRHLYVETEDMEKLEAVVRAANAAAAASRAH